MICCRDDENDDEYEIHLVDIGIVLHSSVILREMR